MDLDQAIEKLTARINTVSGDGVNIALDELTVLIGCLERLWGIKKLKIETGL